jgi:hypothetical protein
MKRLAMAKKNFRHMGIDFKEGRSYRITDGSPAGYVRIEGSGGVCVPMSFFIFGLTSTKEVSVGQRLVLLRNVESGPFVVAVGAEVVVKEIITDNLMVVETTKENKITFSLPCKLFAFPYDCEPSKSLLHALRKAICRT